MSDDISNYNRKNIIILIIFAIGIVTLVIIALVSDGLFIFGADQQYENLVEQTLLPSLDCIEHDREQCIQL